MFTFNLIQKSVLIVLVFSALLVACIPVTNQNKTIAVEPLYNGTWYLVAYGNEQGTTIVEPGLRTFIRFQEDGSISGNAGCNNLMGGLMASEDGSLTLDGPLATTRMACEQFMDAEWTFLTALEGAESFFINESGQLVINFKDSPDGYTHMIFTNQQNALFLGTGWVLESMVTPEGEILISPANAPVINFAEDGSMSGSGGCNRISAEFTAEDGQLSLGEIASTLMACDQGMEIEASFTEALRQVTKFEVIGDRLVLSDDQRSTVLRFFAADLELSLTQWRLYVLNGESIPENVMVTLTLQPGAENSQGTLFGSAGCNRYSGGYSLEADRLKPEVLAVTAMMCDAGMETEAAFLAALQDEMTFQIQYNRLILSSENNILLFVGEKPSLAGSWRLILLGDPENPVEIFMGEPIVAEFSIAEGAPTGLLSGTTSCYAYSARYFTDQDFVSIGTPERSESDSCQEPLDHEAQYFTALQNGVTYGFRQGSLLIFDGEGKQLLEFVTP
jgi:heat shock protein HslJ